MLHVVYTIAFLYLLHIDEVLHLQVQDIVANLIDEDYIKVMLPFRKTHQYGGKWLLHFSK